MRVNDKQRQTTTNTRDGLQTVETITSMQIHQPESLFENVFVNPRGARVNRIVRIQVPMGMRSLPLHDLESALPTSDLLYTLRIRSDFRLE
jgi:hypothetical protein